MSANGHQNGDLAANGQPLPKRRRKQNNVRLAVGVLLVVLVGCYLGFTKNIPFTGGFRFNAVFTAAPSVKAGSPVRIAGVNVGKVVEVKRYGKTSSAEVTMEMSDSGLPIHRDAQLKIRPRIFLEGNFFIDLRPGTPSAPEVENGDTIPVTQTSTPVQLDQVLTSLQYRPREDLQVLLTQLGVGLDTKPTAAEDAQVDPQVRGKTGGEALNSALTYSPAAFKGTALVNQGFLGENAGDLSKFVTGLWKFSEQLGAREAVLSDFVTNFNQTMAAFGSQAPALRKAIGLLGPTLENTHTALGQVDAALPGIRGFAIDLIPAVKETPATINAAIAGGPGTPSWKDSWANQANLLVSPNELQAVMGQLVPTTASTAALIPKQTKFQYGARDMAQCFAKVILPTGGQQIVDKGAGYDFNPTENPAYSAPGTPPPYFVNNGSSPAYKEFWFGLVGLAGESQNYDGNGQYIRALVGGRGDITPPIPPPDEDAAQNANVLLLPTSNPDSATVVGNLPTLPIGTSPRYFGAAKAPDYKPNETCSAQPIPNLNKTEWRDGAADPTGKNPG